MWLERALFPTNPTPDSCILTLSIPRTVLLNSQATPTHFHSKPVSLPRFSVLLIAFWITFVRTAPAQVRPRALDTPPPLPTAPSAIASPGLNPAITGSQPAPVPAATPEEKPDARLDFTNSPIADVLRYYEIFSGKHVIYDNSVQGQITVNVSGITRSQAVRIIETVLNLNGFSVVPADDNVVKVIGLGKPVRPAGVPIYLDVRDVPDNEEVATLLVRLSYLEPQETQGILNQYIPPTASVGFIPLPKAGAMLLTDTGRSLRRLYALIQQIDVSPLSVEDRFFRLERSDVTKAVEFLNSVFETKNSGPTGNAGAAAIPGTAATVRRPIRRVGDDGAPVDAALLAGQPGLAGGASPNGDTLVVGRIILTPDVRTNRVHVVTNRRNMPVIQRLLEEFDANTAFASPVRFPLKFIRPDELLPILVQSLQENGDDKNGATPGATNPNKNGQANTNNSNKGSSGLNTGSNFGGSSGGLSGLGDLNSSIGSGTESIDTTPQEVTVGNNRLIADVSNSSIILLGGADARDKVAAIIAQLDRRSPQVMIHTVIGELSLSKDHELGFQYLLRTKRLGLTNNANLFTSNTASTATTATTTTPAATPSASTSALNALSSLATGLGTNFSGVGGVIAIGNSLDVILAALDSTTRFKTISRPEIVTSNFKHASIASGQTVSISTGSVGSLATSGSTTGVYNQTTQVPAVLKLEVTPQINSDKEVLMEVDQTLNSPLGTSSSINGAASQELSIRTLHNWVSARNGETIVLGGLITQSDNISDSNIPYLSRIPVVGNLFKSRTRDANRSELIILMQPEVVDTANVMADLRHREENKTYLGSDLDRQIDPLEPKKTIRKAIPVQATTTTTMQTKKTIVTGK